MSRIATDIQGPSPPLPLPGNNVLNSGAVVFPGAFDQHGCPLVVFPVDAQDKLTSDVSKAEVVDFVNYFLGLHNRKQEKESLVSAVADLRQASLFTTRFIIETFLLLELHRRTIHTVYMIQPKKRDVQKLLLRLLVPSKSCVSPFKRVLLKEVSDLSNYIDRSQLTPSLGGYLIYCHRSWVTFVKEIDTFVQEFLLVVQRLPSSISTLQTLARQPVPSTYDDLKDFCFTNEAKFQQLRRDLGLDELLRHCEQVVDKLRCPEEDSCYQAMAGTALFTHTAFDMLQNYSRITAAVKKIELLWQQVFSKAKLQLQLCQLREEALLITEQIERLQNEKLQPYSIEIAKDALRADMLTSEFESTIYSPAMALVRCAENVIHTLLEILPPSDVLTREKWVQDLNRLKENLISAVKHPQRTLKTVSDFYSFHNKANSWYSLVLCENLLQKLIGGVSNESQPKNQHDQQECTDIPLWRQALIDFVRKNPCPDVEELVQLAHLANAIPHAELQLAGNQMSKRCMALRKLFTSQRSIPLSDLQLALQWQYELLRSNGSHIDLKGSESDPAMDRSGACPSGQSNACNFSKTCESKAEPHNKENMLCHSLLFKCGPAERVYPSQTTLETFPSSAATGGLAGLGKPPSLSSFDSGFDGTGSNHLEAGVGRDGLEGLSRLAGSRDGFRPIIRQPQIHEENISSVSDSEGCPEEFLFGPVGNTSTASIQIIPKITVDYLNFEIKVKRSATPPQNPWLSLPVDDLENSYTVTITQNPPAQQRDHQRVDPSEHLLVKTDQHTPTETSINTQTEVAQVDDCILTPQDCFEDSDFSDIQNVLSSTVTDVTHEPNDTTESLPTLLWDSYDFHHQKQDTWDKINRSMADNSIHEWDLKEQKGLREVEEILDRAAEILEEEENVLAQEAALDVLMTTEHSSEEFASWGRNDQLGVMSSSELMEAGVLGFESDLDAADSMDHGEFKSTETTAEADIFDDMHNDKSLTEGETSHNSGVLLKDLRRLHILDEMILEENLKIHELRRREKSSLEEEPPELRRCHSAHMDRERFLVDLEREKMEVEMMENSLEKDIQKCKLKKCLVKTRKAVKCSIMERTKSIDLEDGALCNELLLGSRSQHSNPQCLTPKTTFHTHNSNLTPPIPCPYNEAKMALQNPVQPVYTKAPGDSELNQSTKDTEPTGNCATQPILLTPQNVSDREEPSTEIVIQPQEKQGPTSGFVEVSNESTTEIYITTEVCSKPEAFDPGGTSCNPPVPKPRKALLAVHDMPFSLSTSSEQICRLDVEEPYLNAKLEDVLLPLKDALPKPKERKSQTLPKTNGLMLSPDVKHNNNNNNNPLTDLQSSLCCSHNESQARTVSFDVLDEPQMTEMQLSQRFDLVQGPAGEVSLESSLQEPSILTSGSHDPRVADAPLTEDVPDGPPPGSNLHVGLWSGTTPTRYFARSPPNHPQLSTNIREMAHFKTPIVLDTGSGLTKAGFADQDLPTTIFPTVIGLPKYEEIMNGNLERETYIGHEAQHMRGVLALKYPMKNGIICKWDEMEKIWQHTFQQLQIDPEEHPVLLTEAAMNPTENRQRMVELMFESFNVPLTYVAMQAVLALYAAGRTTGVVFDSGDGVSHSVPVFEGYCLPHAVQRFTLAGLDVTLHLKKLLLEQGVCMRTSAEVDIVREIKEKCCCVANNYESELTFGGSSSTEVHYTMPDGQVISLSAERFRAPEILFKPELIGRDHYGMHESIFKSILSSDIDLRRMFLGNIVLSGGNTLLPGLPERLQEEIRGMVPSGMGECVHVTSPKDRDFLVWSGGSVLANLPSFASAWISQEEYEEFGPQIVFRKCF